MWKLYRPLTFMLAWSDQCFAINLNIHSLYFTHSCVRRSMNLFLKVLYCLSRLQGDSGYALYESLPLPFVLFWHNLSPLLERLSKNSVSSQASAVLSDRELNSDFRCTAMRRFWLCSRSMPVTSNLRSLSTCGVIDWAGFFARLSLCSRFRANAGQHSELKRIYPVNWYWLYQGRLCF